MIKYIGSKRLLLPAILSTVQEMKEVESVLDLFSGTSRVGHALKGAGYQVFANDHNAYASTIARCYVETNLEDVEKEALLLIRELNVLASMKEELSLLRPDLHPSGYFEDTFCVKSQFFQPKNGAKVDVIREAIEKKSLDPNLKSVLLVSLMEAADRVDSTTGVQMAYLKSWSERSYNPLIMRMPKLHPASKFGACKAFELDALEMLSSSQDVDLVYLDPPYNQHKYVGNYHIWETLVRWDKPDTYGVAQKRTDIKERKSQFNSKPGFEAAFQSLVDAIKAKRIVVSFSNEGFLPFETFIRILEVKGKVTTKEFDYKRYVGAQIGIHNPQGDVVGEVSHLRNKEYLFIVDSR